MWINVISVWQYLQLRISLSSLCTICTSIFFSSERLITASIHSLKVVSTLNYVKFWNMLGDLCMLQTHQNNVQHYIRWRMKAEWMLRMVSQLEDTYYFSVSSIVQSLKIFYYSIILLLSLPQLLTEFMLNNFIHRKSISFSSTCRTVKTLQLKQGFEGFVKIYMNESFDLIHLISFNFI